MTSGKSPLEWLRASGAHRDVIDGLSSIGALENEGLEAWARMWRECPRGDWLLGIAERLGVDHVTLVRAAIAAARIADTSVDARRVLDVVERWTERSATESEVEAATRQLEEAASRVFDPSADAAARAALAVGYGVADRRVLAGAPAAAAESVIVGSLGRGLELAMRGAHDRCVTAVRTAVPWSAAEPCVKRLCRAG
jgi:hypothetical protein